MSTESEKDKDQDNIRIKHYGEWGYLNESLDKDNQSENGNLDKDKKDLRKSYPNAKPLNADDKRIVNGITDVQQLAPLKYLWAWNYFLNANKNHWTPLDINFSQDVHDFRHKLTIEERHIFVNVLSFLTTASIVATRNIGLAVMEKMCSHEIVVYQARQIYEESMHTWAYQHFIETIGLDQGEIYNRYRIVPEIHAKISIANQRMHSILRSDIDLKNRDELENFVMAYTFFAGIFEGTWFYNGFTPIFALQRRGLMKGTSEALQYIMRDKVMHASFGIRVCKQIIEEEKVKLDPKKIQKMWEEAEAAEEAYSKYLVPDPILGYSQADHIAQFRFIANRRARSLGQMEPFPGAENTLVWLDEQANLKKEKNFFETRVTEYQTEGALSWDNHDSRSKVPKRSKHPPVIAGKSVFPSITDEISEFDEKDVSMILNAMTKQTSAVINKGKHLVSKYRKLNEEIEEILEDKENAVKGEQ